MLNIKKLDWMFLDAFLILERLVEHFGLGVHRHMCL